jgi:DNA-binding transcriptional LysR family regulator
MVPTPHADALRDRVHQLAQEARTVLRPVSEPFEAARLERTFTLRANEGFVDAFAARLIATLAAAAPGVRLRFAPKPDKDVSPLRDGLIDLEIGVLGPTGPEVRIQTLFRDRFVGVARDGHPLLTAGEITPERYAACRHVITSRRGRIDGPVDAALASLGLARTVVAVVPGFPAALAIASASDLVTLVPHSFLGAVEERPGGLAGAGLRRFPLPVVTDGITVSQMWHPRMDADPAHRWLRGVLLAVCRGVGEA